MRLKITSDGTINGSVITDLDTGENISGIVLMSVLFDPNMAYPVATITLPVYEFNVEAVLKDSSSGV